jgi:type VI secretion system protein ImpA
VTEPALLAVPDDDALARPDSAAGILPPATTAEEPQAAADAPAQADQLTPQVAAIGTATPAATIDPAVAALCIPLSTDDPCGPDLDLAGDADYLNFFAQTEGMLPTSFFSAEEGRPFDRSSIDALGQVLAIGPLWERSRDLRLLVMRARLLILDRDLGGFVVAVASIAQWLDTFWDDVHPRGAGDDFEARATALSALDLPTVVFPLQYAPLCEARRIGAVSYRTWMIANGEVKPRAGEQKHPVAALAQAIANAPPDASVATRKQIAMLKASLGRIRKIFLQHGCSAGLENLVALADKLQKFVDPHAALREEMAASAAESDDASANDPHAEAMPGGAPTSLTEAQQALAAIAEYYSRSEPSSPALPLVRQAHQLIGKSFFDVMSILVPTQMDKAAFQIGADQFFELPLGKLPKPSEATPPAAAGQDSRSAGGSGAPQYRIESRPQAIALLEHVQGFFRRAEPSSPVPMLCERARALAERDFMSVLREVLPKAALKTFGAEK